MLAHVIISNKISILYNWSLNPLYLFTILNGGIRILGKLYSGGGSFFFHSTKFKEKYTLLVLSKPSCFFDQIFTAMFLELGPRNREVSHAMNPSMGSSLMNFRKRIDQNVIEVNGWYKYLPPVLNTCYTSVLEIQLRCVTNVTQWLNIRPRKK